MKVGMYQDAMNIPETDAWGTILADITRHLADAMELKYGTEKSDSIRRIKESFLTEIAGPTSDTDGSFS